MRLPWKVNSLVWQAAQFMPTQGSLSDWPAFQRSLVISENLRSLWVSTANPTGKGAGSAEASVR